jgi:hypothetical protein
MAEEILDGADETGEAQNTSVLGADDQDAGKTADEAIAQAAKAEDKAKDADADSKADAQDAAPSEYTDFTLPDGVALDKDALKEFLPRAKEMNLSQSQAQQLVDMRVKEQANAYQSSLDQWEHTQETWRKAGVADEEFGKGKYDESINTARFAVREIGGNDLMDALNETGVGNHPEIIRAFYRMGNAMKEDNVAVGKARGATPKTAAETMYPDQGA